MGPSVRFERDLITTCLASFHGRILLEPVEANVAPAGQTNPVSPGGQTMQGTLDRCERLRPIAPAYGVSGRM